MKLRLLLIFICGITFSSFAQDTYTLRTKLAYCKSEAERLEAELARYKGLLELQSQDVLDLKNQLIKLQDQIVILEEEKRQLKEVSVNMLLLAQRFEQDGNLDAALKMYKLLIKVYPTSLEAASSRIKLSELKPK
ncbi:MAG: hypothetical protein GY827_02075 [Cytophagales bacterium]|nr:hypothetical protein [Cytophagales bacterium]